MRRRVPGPVCKRSNPRVADAPGCREAIPDHHPEFGGCGRGVTVNGWPLPEQFSMRESRPGPLRVCRFAGPGLRLAPIDRHPDAETRGGVDEPRGCLDLGIGSRRQYIWGAERFRTGVRIPGADRNDVPSYFLKVGIMNQHQQGLPVTGRETGLALMGAVVVMIVGSLLTPGISVIDPVDQTDFSKALDTLGQNANLSHVTTLLALISMLLYTKGFLGIYRAVRSEPGPAGSALRIGIGASIFGWAIFSVAMGMRHMAIHLMQRSVEEAQMAESLVQAAGGVFVAITAMLIAFFAVFPVGTLLTGIGLAARCRTVGLGMIASWGLIVMGAAAFLNFQVAMHYPGFDPALMLQVNNTMLGLGSALIFVLGLGLFRNRRPATGS